MRANYENYRNHSKSPIMKNRFSALILACALTLPLVSAKASVVDLGAASGFILLTYNTPNISDSAFNGGLDIGVVNGDWKQSGGARTNTQTPTDVVLSPGHNNNGPAVLNTVFNA